MLYEDNYCLVHYGIKGQLWGVRRFQNLDGTLTEEGKKRYRSIDTIFVSGSSKTQDPSSEFYRKELPKQIKDELDAGMKANSKFIVGDAPGIDRQVQEYLNSKKYDRVEVYGPGKEVRYTANKDWKTHPIDDPDHAPGSKEWLAKKDEVMTRASTVGLAVVIEDGASATRKNISRLMDQNKEVSIFSLNKNGKDDWIENDFKTAYMNKATKNGEVKIDQKIAFEIDKKVKNDSRYKKALDETWNAYAKYNKSNQSIFNKQSKIKFSKDAYDAKSKKLESIGMIVLKDILKDYSKSDWENIMAWWYSKEIAFM